MGRVIKFRVWNSSFNKMQDWEAVKTFGRFSSIETHEFLTFLQYTGLKDKNGKEIYEGDILQGSNGKRYEIRWGINSNGFIAQTKEIHGNVYSSYHLAPKTEVIGNIYENPNLIVGDGS